VVDQTLATEADHALIANQEAKVNKITKPNPWIGKSTQTARQKIWRAIYYSGSFTDSISAIQYLLVGNTGI
jgi:hypothetical protein